MKVYKYVLEATEKPQKIGEGFVTTPVHVAFQGDDLCVWAEVSEINPVLRYHMSSEPPSGSWMQVVPTGFDVYPSGVYVGTAHHPSEPLVFHVYWLKGVR